MGYKFSHKHKTGKKDVTLTEAFTTAWDGVVLDNEEDYYQHYSYRWIIFEHIWKLSNEGNPAVIEHIRSLKSTNIREVLLKKHLAYELEPSNAEISTIYDALMELSKDSLFKDKTTKRYNIIRSLMPGNPAPNFEGYDNLEGGTTSLEDLKGKYVYIDVWATWCGWCKKEFPYLKELELEFKGKNIHFVSVSIDEAKNRQKWVEMVAKEQLGGIQLLAPGDWKSSIVNKYAIDGVPRFILIDPNGKIVNVDAPRPSKPELKELLTELVL